MTEYSVGSKNKLETVSQTNGRTNPNQYPSNFPPETDNPSKYSQESHVSTGIMEGFQIHIQNILPLISAIKDQNEQIKEEKLMIESDMKKLTELSNNLLEENSKMRRHYSERTNDIRKLVESITINMNQEFNDITHESHLIKQANLMIVRKIEENMKIMAEMDSKNKARQNQIRQFVQNNLEKDDKMRSILVRNKQLFNQCQNLKGTLKKLDNTDLESEVNKLITSVCLLKKKNLTYARQAKNIFERNKTEKPQLQYQHQNIRQMIKALDIQVKQMSDQSDHFKAKLDNAMESHQKKYNIMKERHKLYQKSKLRQDLQLNELMNMQKQINFLKLKGKKETLDAIEKSQGEKEKLVYEVAEKKKKIQKLQDEIVDKRQEIMKNHKKHIDQIKNQLSNQNTKITEQLLLKLNPQSANIASILQQRTSQYSQLIQEVQSLRRNVQSLDNPIKQIIKLDYTLRKQVPTRR